VIHNFVKNHGAVEDKPRFERFEFRRVDLLKSSAQSAAAFVPLEVHRCRDSTCKQSAPEFITQHGPCAYNVQHAGVDYQWQSV
jgi:hypothetical protein